jgi:hypothetical protein
MPWSRPCSAVEAFEFDTALAAPEELLLTPRSVVNLLKAAFRSETFLFADALGALAEALGLPLLLRALMSDSSLLRMPPWPCPCP